MRDCIVFDDAGNSVLLKINEERKTIISKDDETGETSSRRIGIHIHPNGNKYLFAHFMDRPVSKSELNGAVDKLNPSPFSL